MMFVTVIAILTLVVIEAIHVLFAGIIMIPVF